MSDGIQVHVHPLVALNISEHWTRSRLANPKDPKACGVLLGSVATRGEIVVASNSFDLNLSEADLCGTMLLNNEKVTVRLQQYKEVFPELEFVGWYTTCCEHTNEQMQLPRDSIIVQLCPQANMAADKLPLIVYKVGEKEASVVEWALISEDSERIGVEHVAKLSKVGSDSAESGVTASSRHFRSTASIVDMMKSRIQTVVAWLEAVEAGRVPYDSHIALEVAKVALMAKQFAPADQKFEPFLKTHITDVRATQLLAKMVSLISSDLQTTVDSLRLRDTQTAAVEVELIDADDTTVRPGSLWRNKDPLELWEL